MELPPRLMTLSDIIELYGYSKNNKDILRKTINCGCFNCKKIFPTYEIKDWIDDGKTAVCPFCKTASITISTLNWQLNDTVLDVLHKYFFKS